MHLSDEQLHALLDGELPRVARDDARLHLVTCARCEGRLKEVERHRQQVSQLLSWVDSPVPRIGSEDLMRHAARQTRRSRGLLAAAVATLLVGGVAAAMAGVLPVSWLRRLIVHPRGHVAASVTDTAGLRGGVSIVPGQFMEIVFRQGQQTGSIRIGATADSELSVRTVGDTVTYTVGPTSVVIANTAGTQATYDIRIPRFLSRVTIRVGRQVVYSKDHTAIAAPVAPDPRTGEYRVPFSAIQP